MAKIIFTSRYMKGAVPEHLKHYVRYVATRDGVEKLDDSKKHLPSTKEQEKLITSLVKEFPDAKSLLEYEDYITKPTRLHATQLIQQVMDVFVLFSADRENYVDYIGTRPGAEQYGSHGLFTDQGVPIVLSQVQDEVARHKGVIWTHVVSLKREDAARLGYDNGRAWQALLRSKRAMFCKEMQIDSKNLRWYAAFHNESHHPHVHIMVYSKEPTEGYLSKKAIQNMRSELAHDIFRQEFLQIYEEQKASREQLLKQTRQVLARLQVDGKRMVSEEFQSAFLQLVMQLQRYKGKMVYGYLKKEQKQLVNHLVNLLAEEDEIKEAYRVWKEWKFAIQEVYGGTEKIEKIKLSEEKNLKVIKNMVIKSAVAFHHTVMENTWIQQDTVQEQGSLLHTMLDQQNHFIKETIQYQGNALVKALSDLFYEELKQRVQSGFDIDRKRRQKLRQKREALGQKSDDTMESQT